MREPVTSERGGRAAALRASWRDDRAIVNLRGDPDEPAFVAAAGAALGLALPGAGSTVEADGLRVVWAGPDDWFVIGAPGQAAAIERRLRDALAGRHAAVTDVSGGYAVLRLAGPAARDALAQGCPLDLHPRAFGPARAAGSHYFKASVWLWQLDDAPTFELLVRRSFVGYVRLMLERTTLEGGLVDDAGG